MRTGRANAQPQATFEAASMVLKSVVPTAALHRYPQVTKGGGLLATYGPSMRPGRQDPRSPCPQIQSDGTSVPRCDMLKGASGGLRPGRILNQMARLDLLGLEQCRSSHSRWLSLRSRVSTWHPLPFTGIAHSGYLPARRMVGLSKSSGWSSISPGPRAIRQMPACFPEQGKAPR